MLGAVVFVLAVIALVIALIVPGPNIAVAGFAVSAVTALNATGAALIIAMLGGQVAMWRTGHGSFSDVAWSVAGLATFGAGLALAPVARALGGRRLAPGPGPSPPPAPGPARSRPGHRAAGRGGRRRQGQRWSTFSSVVLEPGRQAEAESARRCTVDRWSTPLLHVR